jgi:hypothetical protein
MYDTRWPRPGPATAAVCAVVGLLIGVALGLSSGGGPAEARSARKAAGRPATTLPGSFYTVVLASIPTEQGRQVANARAASIRRDGLQDVGVLESSRYPKTLNPGYFVVYSGLFPTEGEASDHRDEIASRFPELARSYVRPVRA